MAYPSNGIPLSVALAAAKGQVSEMSKDYTVFRGIVRNYRSRPVSSPDEDVDCPYSGMLHDLTDKKICQMPDLFGKILIAQLGGYDKTKRAWHSPVPENKVVEIIVRITDEYSPLGDDPWGLLEPHVYGPSSTVMAKQECDGGGDRLPPDEE